MVSSYPGKYLCTSHEAELWEATKAENNMQHQLLGRLLMKVESHKETNSLCGIRPLIIRLDGYKAIINFTKKHRLNNNCAELVKEEGRFPTRLGGLIFTWLWDNLQSALTQHEVVS